MKGLKENRIREIVQEELVKDRRAATGATHVFNITIQMRSNGLTAQELAERLTPKTGKGLFS